MSPSPRPTQRRPTLRMVAERAGVSIATVSYVFSGRSGAASGSGVAAETSARVLAAAEELNYRPNRAARAVRTGRSGMVQLSLNMLSDPWSLAVADAVNIEADRRGLTTLILASGDWYRALDRVESDVAYLDGLGDDDEARDRVRDLAARGQRLVVFDERLEADGFDVIRSEALPGCELAMAHLLERHTAIGCLTGVSARRRALRQRTRYSVYIESMAARGLTHEDRWTQEFSETQGSAFEAAVRLLTGERRPTAIYATTDFAGIAAINAAQMLGLSVPHDVSIVGVGNTPRARDVGPTLTTVGPTDFYRRQARIIVDRAIAGDSDPYRVHEFPWVLVPGGSTDLDSAGPRRR